jgi:hypothetical protein
MKLKRLVGKHATNLVATIFSFITGYILVSAHVEAASEVCSTWALGGAQFCVTQGSCPSGQGCGYASYNGGLPILNSCKCLSKDTTCPASSAVTGGAQ